MVVVGLFGLAIGFNASSLDPFIFNEKVRLLAPPELKNTALGIITILALLMALVVQPLIGQWSDRTRGRLGRRAPYLTAGAAGLGVALTLVVLADSLWLLIVAAMLASAFANTTQAAWQALIPDQVPLHQHGRAAGVKTVLELIGVVAGVALAGYTLARGQLWGAPAITFTLFVVILVITLATLRQSDSPAGEVMASQPARPNPFSALVSSLKQAPPSFFWWMLNRFLFWSSAISIRTFMLNYLEDVMGFTPAESHSLSSRIFVVLGAGVLVLALPAGALADKIGRRPILVAAGLLAASGVVLFVMWQNLFWLYVGGGLIAAGAGIFASASWALATDLAPKNEGALYLALANGATVVGSIGGRLGGPLIDGINGWLDTVTLGYLVVFAIAALLFAGSSLVVLKIPDRQHRVA